MRWLAGGVSTVFILIGVTMIRDGDRTGWWMTGFFGLCLLVAMFEHRLPTPWLDPEYRVVTMPEGIACEHPRRKREAIAWTGVEKVWYVTTSAGPRLPDQWILLEGKEGGCSFPTEAKGFEAFMDVVEAKFPGFDFGPMIRGGTDDARHLCWERGRAGRTDGGPERA